MKVKLLIAATGLVFLSNCTKDKFSTKPQLTFKSVNTSVLYPAQDIVFTIDYTDKEGDIQNNLYVEKVTSNCPSSDFDDTYQMPQDVPATGNQQGTIEVRFSYGQGNYPLLSFPKCVDNDTCVFKFVLTDKAGNISDTAVSSQIVMIKN